MANGLGWVLGLWVFVWLFGGLVSGFGWVLAVCGWRLADLVFWVACGCRGFALGFVIFGGFRVVAGFRGVVVWVSGLCFRVGIIYGFGGLAGWCGLTVAGWLWIGVLAVSLCVGLRLRFGLARGVGLAELLFVFYLLLLLLRCLTVLVLCI